MALARGTLSFVIKDPDEGVVAAVGLEARQPSLAAVPTERQDLLLFLRLLLRLAFVKATLAAVVHLNERYTRLEKRAKAPSCRLGFLWN